MLPAGAGAGVPVPRRLHGLVWGFFVSSVLVWHSSFAINSLSHMSAVAATRRRRSRNNWLLALLTRGEGWHNNHHHYQRSANQGFRWWEIDFSWYVLRILEVFGIVWDLRRPPESALNAPRP